MGVQQMLLVNMLTDMFPALAVVLAPLDDIEDRGQDRLVRQV